MTTSSHPERRRAAQRRLVVFDLESMTHEWTGIVEPDDLTDRSVIVGALLEARRESDTFLIGCAPEFSWALSELFPGAALFLGGLDDTDRPIVHEVRRRLNAGNHGEICVASCDPAMLALAESRTATESTIRSTSREECRELLAAISGDIVLSPDFVIGKRPA